MRQKIQVALIIFLALGPEALAQVPRDWWVDSVFSTMSTQEKIGQLFMLRVPAGISNSGWENLKDKVQSTGAGGIVHVGRRTLTHAELNWDLRSAAGVPLLIAAEVFSETQLAEDSPLNYPAALALGAIRDDSLLMKMGRQVGKELRLTGVDMTFIPANVGNEAGTVGGFGDNRFNVAAKALSFWRGVRSQGVLACATYFPVQAITVSDIQKGRPSVQLFVDSLRAYPFNLLADNGLPAMMPEAKDLPLFYNEKKTAVKNLFSSAALTASFAGDWIRKNLDYDGLIVIDVDRMTSAKFKAGEAASFAFEAGNDLLITSENAAVAIRRIRRLLRNDKTLMGQLDRSVKKILAAKYDAIVRSQFPPADPKKIPLLVSTPDARKLRQNLFHSSVTVIANENNTLPVQTLDNKRFTCIYTADSSGRSDFSRWLSKYADFRTWYVDENTAVLPLADTLRTQQHAVVVALFPDTKRETLLNLLPQLRESRINQDVIICDFGSEAFRPLSHEFQTIVTAYGLSKPALLAMAEVVFGGIPARGVLPVAFGHRKTGTAATTGALGRLTYSFPEDAGMDSRTLAKIADIAREAIETRATPGCHVLIARNGKVVYEESFGYLTYERQRPVTENTLYDLASVTKVAATLQAVMFMHEKGLIDIYKKASYYLPELKASNKKDYTLKDILTHQAGLWPFLPFWAQTMKDSTYLPEYYSDRLSKGYPLVVSDRLFASAAMKDSLWHWIVDARVREKPQRTPYDYRYSDMGFYILHRLAERILNQPMDDFLAQNLYEPLGAYTAGYQPLLRHPIDQIAPTENDRLFRKSLLIGTVHDQGAAMLGGVAGHAGLFGTATDLAKLGQMLLQEGQYGGLQYFKPGTVRLFATRQYENSPRGLGWHKPSGDWNSATSVFASPRTFGHTGFTGTCIWIDPEFELVYIFLSNRVHPDMTNNKLLTANIRSRIQDVAYQAIFDYCKMAESESGTPLAMPIEPIGRIDNK